MIRTTLKTACFALALGLAGQVASAQPAFDPEGPALPPEIFRMIKKDFARQDAELAALLEAISGAKLAVKPKHEEESAMASVAEKSEAFNRWPHLKGLPVEKEIREFSAPTGTFAYSRHASSEVWSLANGRFELKWIHSGRMVAAKGSLVAGKPAVSEVTILSSGTTHHFDRLKDVPEAYREAIAAKLKEKLSDE